MAFDAGMLACMICEINRVAAGGKIERVTQPERDELVLQMRTRDGAKRLRINAGSNPRIGFSELSSENPASPPMFCMLLRKYLTGARLDGAAQIEFERASVLTFSGRDEMGFACRRYLIVELMGKYANIIFAEPADESAGTERMRMIACMRTVDVSESSKRQILPGMLYELPPSQGKINPVTVSETDFYGAFAGFSPDMPVDKAILTAFCGISSSVAREIAYRATGSTDGTLRSFDFTAPDVDARALWQAFDGVFSTVRSGDFRPTLISDGSKHIEYAFIPLTQYRGFESVGYGSAGLMLDEWFRTKDKDSRLHQRASDILRILSANTARIRKKLEIQTIELGDCSDAEKYKRYGDLITANLYALSRGMTHAELIDYNAWNQEKNDYDRVNLTLDGRLSPSANAQKYYKKYTKARHAEVFLTEQIQKGREELTYLESVTCSLQSAETLSDLDEIREELHGAGYASRAKNRTEGRAPKAKQPLYAEFVTSGGFRILCGKNNTQNEYVTHKVAEKYDYWFHAKGVAGSHVVLLTRGGQPSDADMTQAAEIAALYSQAKGGAQIPVDYLRVRELHKVPGARPGFVIYHTNQTAYVTPDEKAIASLRVIRKNS